MENYDFLCKIAEGAYGTVWKCEEKTSKKIVAVKKLKDPAPIGSEEYEFAIREVRLLQLLQHRNVVELIQAYQSSSGRLYLVFEYVDNTLLSLLKGAPSGFPAPLVKSLTWQMLYALKYMHKKQVIHRDIKPSNILVTDTGVVKLCDFGFARALDRPEAVADYTSYVVTRWYRSPEVMVGDVYGPAVDIWAAGCICAELMTGRALFPGRNNNDQLWLVLRGIGRLTEAHMRLLRMDPQFASFRLPLPHEYLPIETRLKGLTPDAMHFIKSCLNPDPSRRLNADQLLKHPYFKDVEKTLPFDISESPMTYNESSVKNQGDDSCIHKVTDTGYLPRQQVKLYTYQEENEVLSSSQPQQSSQGLEERTKAAIATATATIAAAAETVLGGAYPESGLATTAGGTVALPPSTSYPSPFINQRQALGGSSPEANSLPPLHMAPPDNFSRQGLPSRQSGTTVAPRLPPYSDRNSPAGGSARTSNSSASGSELDSLYNPLGMVHRVIEANRTAIASQQAAKQRTSDAGLPRGGGHGWGGVGGGLAKGHSRGNSLGSEIESDLTLNRAATCPEDKLAVGIVGVLGNGILADAGSAAAAAGLKTVNLNNSLKGYTPRTSEEGRAGVHLQQSQAIGRVHHQAPNAAVGLQQQQQQQVYRTTAAISDFPPQAMTQHHGIGATQTLRSPRRVLSRETVNHAPVKQQHHNLNQIPEPPRMPSKPDAGVSRRTTSESGAPHPQVPHSLPLSGVFEPSHKGQDGLQDGDVSNDGRRQSDSAMTLNLPPPRFQKMALPVKQQQQKPHQVGHGMAPLRLQKSQSLLIGGEKDLLKSTQPLPQVGGEKDPIKSMHPLPQHHGPIQSLSGAKGYLAPEESGQVLVLSDINNNVGRGHHFQSGVLPHLQAGAGLGPAPRDLSIIPEHGASSGAAAGPRHLPAIEPRVSLTGNVGPPNPVHVSSSSQPVHTSSGVPSKVQGAEKMTLRTIPPNLAPQHGVDEAPHLSASQVPGARSASTQLAGHSPPKAPPVLAPAAATKIKSDTASVRRGVLLAPLTKKHEHILMTTSS